jgi:hypothetical protein
MKTYWGSRGIALQILNPVNQDWGTMGWMKGPNIMLHKAGNGLFKTPDYGPWLFNCTGTIMNQHYLYQEETYQKMVII